MGHSRLRAMVTQAAAASVFAGLLFCAAPRAKADDCQGRIRHADRELHKAAEKHGWDSPQAAERRRQLNEARAYCWEHGHRWWDEEGHRWRTEHDWDEHDHDHR